MNTETLSLRSKEAHDLLKSCIADQSGESLDGIRMYLVLTLGQLFASTLTMEREQKFRTLKELLELVERETTSLAMKAAGIPGA